MIRKKNTQEFFLRFSLEVASLLGELRQSVPDRLRPQHPVADVHLHEQASLVHVHRRHVAGPDLVEEFSHDEKEMAQKQAINKSSPAGCTA